MDADRITKLRRKYFARCCPESVIEDIDLYHGSPLEGLEQIRRCKGLRTQDHGELRGEWLCVSPNDNMLRFFSDGEGVTGLCFNVVEPLRVVRLDWFHAVLISEMGVDYYSEYRSVPKDIANIIENRGDRLGYGPDRWGDYGLGPQAYRALLPDWCDGVILPHYELLLHGAPYPSAHNDEAEVTLTQRGCDRIWKMLSGIVIGDDWFDDVKEGWKQVAKRWKQRIKKAA